MDLERQWIDGDNGTWTDAELDKLVESGVLAKLPAPVCIGHPADDAPVWGWLYDHGDVRIIGRVILWHEAPKGKE